MELVVQFGYVILFGQVFPLAAVFSMFSNGIQIDSQVGNLEVSRRVKPEVSLGIGNWMFCLEILGQVNVVTNTVLLFFTHRNFKEIFVNEAE